MLVILSLLFSMTAQADSSDLRTKAQMEVARPIGPSGPPTDAATGILKLKDPAPDIEKRKWNYFVTLSAQSFQPMGHVGNDLTKGSFDLGQTPATVMPAVELGFDAPILVGDWRLRWGLAGRAAYISQKTTALFSTGFRETDVHLITTMLSLKPNLSIGFPGLAAWKLNLGFEAGVLNYNQASSNDLAAVNIHAGYFGVSLGPEYAIRKSWSVLLDYSNRQLSSVHQDIALQENSFELGSKLIW
jgi:hypothetical protein